MSKPKTNFQTFNGNQAAAHVAFALSEGCAIYPITPSSDMAEYCDIWSSEGKKNIFGSVPKVIEMQSEAGAAGTLHGMLAGGILATTFTASQGLLLKIPNMYKIVGELLPGVIHVSARAVASHALSIFGDHSDVYSVRATGVAMIASNSVQESMDLGLVSQLSAIESHYPFLHFFDGFRTSHEFNKIGVIDYADINKLVNHKRIADFRKRALNPTHPHQQGTAQNPDTYFQNREGCNKVIASLPETVQQYMDKVAAVTGRKYKLFDYVGHPQAEHITIAMGSGVEAIEEAIDKLNTQGKKYGLVKVRLFRPFSAKHLIDALPESTKIITVLDRTKENGAQGDPLFLDVCTALFEAGCSKTKVLAGRYGLGSKEFTPEMVAAIYDNSEKGQKHHFTVGINDDVTNTNLQVKPREDLAEAGGYKFYGLGSDGTVGANRNSCAIIGDNTDLFAQAYFVYDSKKSGGITTSHLRFGKDPIRSTYLVNYPIFVACHNQSFLTRFDMLKGIKKGGTFLLNTNYTKGELEKVLPASVKQVLAQKQIKFYVINAYKIAEELGMGRRINTVMQSAFFKLTEVIPFEQAKKFMKDAALVSYGKKGQKVLDMNYKAIDSADTALVKVDVPAAWANATGESIYNKKSGNKYYDEFCHVVSTLRGNDLPVSAFSPDGRVPIATSQYEKRSIATSLPEWLPEHCIQCNQCALVCPHCCLRGHLIEDELMKKAPKSFKTLKATGFPNMQYKIQLSPEDCTGCGMCANVCPSKTKALVMKDYADVDETANYAFSLKVPYPKVEPTNVKNSQFLKPYFEFSGACAGCGETQYIKLASQLFGRRMIVANATGCTSIYCGSSPTCPYTTDEKGHGPAWANSLFEDNAEFGYGIEQAYELRTKTGEVQEKPSVWIIGGDGWAYDIGFGGLDHVLASNADVNLLVLDTEVYSNTGGQASKATPSGSIAKFAAGGMPNNKKDLGAIAMNYDHVYVAQVAIGADMNQTLKAFKEAEAHKGPSLIIAYSTCINHGIDMSQGMKVMKNAVECGYWTLYRRDPKVGLVIDSKAPNTEAYIQFLQSENRYKALESIDPKAAKKLFEQGKVAAEKRHERYVKLAANTKK